MSWSVSCPLHYQAFVLYQKSIQVEAIVLPKVMSDLPLHPVSFGCNLHHLSGICLADPDFGSPSKVDLLLGADIFSDVMLQRRCVHR